MRALAVGLVASLSVLGGAIAARAVQGRTSVVSASSCPAGVEATASVETPVTDVLREAQKRLATRTIDSMGQKYRLTPRNAPIDFIAGFSPYTTLEQATPGLAAIQAVASSACGSQTADASWAIHYSVNKSVIASFGTYTYFVKTRTGWRFWGNWCGATKSATWRHKYCI